MTILVTHQCMLVHLEITSIFLVDLGENEPQYYFLLQFGCPSPDLDTQYFKKIVAYKF